METVESSGRALFMMRVVMKTSGVIGIDFLDITIKTTILYGCKKTISKLQLHTNTKGNHLIEGKCLIIIYIIGLTKTMSFKCTF